MTDSKSIYRSPELENLAGSDSAWALFRSQVPGTREQIIDQYLPFARMLAAKTFACRTYFELEFDDYFQFASIGLIEAVDRFDMDRGIKFETFATLRITGSILSGIETLSEKQEQINARRRIVSDRVSSMKTDLQSCGNPAALFGHLAEMALGLAIGFALEDSGMYQADEPSYPDNTYMRVELKQLHHHIESLVRLMPDKERQVVTYHYLQRMGFDEIAAILGVTKGRISQIHKEALGRLRKNLRAERSVDLSC